MIKYIQEDLFKSECDIIIHGCNCFCKWGAGIAKQMKLNYPEAYQKDLETTIGDKSKLGTFTHAYNLKHIYNPNKLVTIINAYTQYNYGRDIINFDYYAFKTVMKDIKILGEGLSKAIPKIGAGLAGGDWKLIEQILNEIYFDETIYVYYLKG